MFLYVVAPRDWPAFSPINTPNPDAGMFNIEHSRRQFLGELKVQGNKSGSPNRCLLIHADQAGDETLVTAHASGKVMLRTLTNDLNRSLSILRRFDTQSETLRVQHFRFPWLLIFES